MSGVLASRMGSGPPGTLAAALSNSSNAISCSADIQNDGEHVFGDGIGGAATEAWVTPTVAAVAAAYEVRVDVNSGTFSTGTTGTWLACSTSRAWTKVGSGVVNFNMSFRQVGGPTLKTYSGMTMTVP